MCEGIDKYFKDDGTEFNPNLISKQSLCATCKKDDNATYEIACSLTRADQNEGIFICFAYENIGGQSDTETVLKEKERYLDQKYGKARQGEE